MYLDTDLWNALFCQKVDPGDLMERLDARGACLAFSSHNLYEIAKSFHETKATTKAKGKELVAFLTAFFNDPVEHPVESSDLLKAEAFAHKFLRAPFASEIFVKASATNLFKQESRALLKEPLRSDIADFISKRKMKTRNLRVNQMEHLGSRPALSARLKVIPREQLKSFLDAESTSSQALRILDFHLRHVLPGLPSGELRRLSNMLLHSGSAPFAHGLIRSALYMNWRAANHGGLAPDVPDDMYHILNATYCDIYATGEAKQSHAIDLLASRTLFRAYPWSESVAINDWLVSLV
jgi:hypothetical protein